MARILVFWGLCWGPPILGELPPLTGLSNKLETAASTQKGSRPWPAQSWNAH